MIGAVRFEVLVGMKHNKLVPNNQKGFYLLAIPLILVVLGVVGFVAYYIIGSNQNEPTSADRRGPNYHALAPCGDSPLRHLPADLSQLEQISSLGNVDPPDHTLPTDHLYMMYPYGTDEQRSLFAPADIVVTGVGYSREIFQGQDRGGDYKLTFYPCSQLQLQYGHVDSLHEAIQSAIGTPEAPGSGRCETNSQADSTITNCLWDTDITLRIGDIVGTSNGWDVWATYEGHKGNVVSASYYHNIDAVCPWDYFTPALRTQLYAKVRRTTEPRCGEAYQDKDGTLQGGWFGHKDPQQAKADWSSHFSLTHDAADTSIGQLAVGGMISKQFMYRFTPKHSDNINTEPGKTQAGVLYCYQHEGDARFPNGRIAGEGKVLLKLINNHTMQIEHQIGNCTPNESFSRPASYYR